LDKAVDTSITLFSVQLLTVPSITQHLVEYHGALSLLLTYLKFHFLPEAIDFSPDHLDALVLAKSKLKECETDAMKKRRYYHMFGDLKYILGNQRVREFIPMHPKFLVQFTDFVLLFQGMNPQKRASGDHVEYESETWVNSFNLTLQLAKVCKAFGSCWKDHGSITVDGLGKDVRWILCCLKTYIQDSLKESIGRSGWMNLMRSSLYTVSFGGQECRVVRCNVAKETVSFHNPLHWLLARVLTPLAELTPDQLEGTPLSAFFYGEHAVDAETMMRILDYPLQVVVMMAQIRAGVWVRNGFSIRSQVSQLIYFDLWVGTSLPRRIVAREHLRQRSVSHPSGVRAL
jgi:E3 ubiquitin-protein ligase UBR1